jgi:hypothetical protein
VLDDVREQALKGIAWCEHPDRDPELYPFGLAELAKLRAALGAPPPAPRVPKPVKLPGEKGDVLAVRFGHTDGEAVVVVGGPVEVGGRGPGCGRVVLLPDLAPDAVTPESVRAALVAWRQLYEVWPDMLGRRFGCYDVTGKLPARKTRKLINALPFPEGFERRMSGTGATHRAADVPYVVEYDIGQWRTRKWATDPRDSAHDA